MKRISTATLVTVSCALVACQSRGFRDPTSKTKEAEDSFETLVRPPTEDEREGLIGLICIIGRDVESKGDASTFRSYIPAAPQCQSPNDFAKRFNDLFVRPYTDANNAFMTFNENHPQESESRQNLGFVVEAFTPRLRPGLIHAQLLDGAGKTFQKYGVCFHYKNCFTVFRVESAKKRFWVFGEIPSQRLADVPVLQQERGQPSDFSKAEATTLRQAMVTWLQAHPQTTIDIYRSASSGSRFFSMYKKGNIDQDFTDKYSRGTAVTHFALNILYAEKAGDGGSVVPSSLGLVKASLPSSLFVEMLNQERLQAHVLRNSVMTHPPETGIYVVQAPSTVFGGLPLELLLKQETADDLVTFSKPKNGGYQGMFCSFPGVEKPCPDQR